MPLAGHRSCASVVENLAAHAPGVALAARLGPVVVCIRQWVTHASAITLFGLVADARKIGSNGSA